MLNRGTSSLVVLVFALALAAPAAAQTYLLDVNGSPPGQNDAANPVVVPAIPAGTYDVSFIGIADGGQFDAINYWGSVSGCDGSGANCSTGYLHRVTCSIPGVGDVQINPLPEIWQTPALALANAPTGLSFEADAGDLECWIVDGNYSDNIGGISLQLDLRQVTVAIPTLGAAGLAALIAGLAVAALLLMRRRQRTA